MTDGLDERLRRIEERLDALEQALRSRPSRAEPEGGDRDLVQRLASAGPPEAKAEPAATAETFPLVGRTLLALGGAFVLRALTEAGILPPVAGAALAVVYAALWLVMADRAAARGHAKSATFHGIASAIIALPLLWEATVKFGFFSPPVSAAILAGLVAAALVVAARRALPAPAWVVVLGGALTALALGFGTRRFTLFVGLLLAIGLATLIFGYARKALPLAWTLALLSGLAVIVMTLGAIAGRERIEEQFPLGALVGLQLALAVVYCATIALASVRERRQVTIAEIFFGAAAFVTGLGGAVVVTRLTGTSDVGLGAVAALFAAGGYGLGFRVIDAWRGERRSFIVFTTSALAAILVALETLLDGSALVIGLAVAAVAAAALGSRTDRATLSGHGAILLAVGAALAGTAPLAWSAFTAPAEEIAPPDLAGWVVLAAAVAISLFPVPTHGRTWGRLSRMPKLVVLIVATLAAAGAAAALGSRLVPPGTLAPLRTAVIAVATVALAAAGRWPLFFEAAWLVYPLLVLGGLKIVTEDLRSGRAAMIIISLALYGGALIVAPRLRTGNSANSVPPT